MVTYYGTSGNDTLVGSDGDDALYGFGGNDLLDGSWGFDLIDGGSGNDTVSYAFYNGGIILNLSTGVVSFPGNSSRTDTLVSIENAIGSGGNDTLIGTTSSNVLSGGMGNDSLIGSGTYYNSYDYDQFYGGSGSDVFVLGNSAGSFYLGSGYATIKDWDAVNDYIQVNGSSSRYTLRYENWSGSSALDTAIYYGNDLIGVVQDTTNVSLSRDFLAA